MIVQKPHIAIKAVHCLPSNYLRPVFGSRWHSTWLIGTMQILVAGHSFIHCRSFDMERRGLSLYFKDVRVQTVGIEGATIAHPPKNLSYCSATLEPTEIQNLGVGCWVK